MKKIIKAIGLTMVTFATVAGVAMAGPLDNDSLTKVAQKIKPGALTLKAPADVDLGEITASSEVVPVTGEAVDFQVDDARGNKNPVGWDATVTMSRLTDTGDATTYVPFDDPNDPNPATNKVYELTPNDKAAYYGADVNDITLGAATELLDTDSDGVSDAVAVMSAAAGAGKGRFESDMTIDLQVPANSVASDFYESTMTFTVS